MEMQTAKNREDTLRKGEDLFQSYTINLVWNRHSYRQTDQRDRVTVWKQKTHVYGNI